MSNVNSKVKVKNVSNTVIDLNLGEDREFKLFPFTGEAEITAQELENPLVAKLVNNRDLVVKLID